jgi:hypothetical protein
MTYSVQFLSIYSRIYVLCNGIKPPKSSETFRLSSHLFRFRITFICRKTEHVLHILILLHETPVQRGG